MCPVSGSRPVCTRRFVFLDPFDLQATEEGFNDRIVPAVTLAATRTAPRLSCMRVRSPVQNGIGQAKSLVAVSAEKRKCEERKRRCDQMSRVWQIRRFLAAPKRIGTSSEWREQEHCAEQWRHGTSPEITVLVVKEDAQPITNEGATRNQWHTDSLHSMPREAVKQRNWVPDPNNDEYQLRGPTHHCRNWLRQARGNTGHKEGCPKRNQQCLSTDRR